MVMVATGPAHTMSIPKLSAKRVGSQFLVAHPGTEEVAKKKRMARGLPIKYLRFALPQEGELREPCVDIPLDDYRSYHREKRSPKETGR